ncbi:F0F1 ATP synthase subunit B [Cellulomonas marina]|uniref:ATP synthase subunit b n=1 Tax=Cellulomonas marina TaxID=988821 RepID=A0A1I1AUT4_9CELL|nr:F0F1 ATP synthase subunit B [Cellulomonas marina]GIG30243.1 ATP synthase subunit b [Cellulomonas marina]SFB41156.1 F-type H+-transporting ATPase subunit b [Cellulomonas marina]
MSAAAIPAALVTAAAETHEEQSVLIPAGYDLFWSAVVTLVILVVFIRYVMPRFTTVLDERTRRIEGGLAQAETAQAEADAKLAELNRQLADARTEAGRIREEARADGAAIVAEARTKAQEEAARVVETAHRQIEAERRQAAVSLRHDVGALATQLAEKIVGEALTDEGLRSRVVDRFLDELDATQPTTAGAADTKGY